MKIGLKFEGASCTFGFFAALAINGLMPPWFMLIALLLLFDFPGPKLSYSSKSGWSFTWWRKRPDRTA